MVSWFGLWLHPLMPKGKPWLCFTDIPVIAATGSTRLLTLPMASQYSLWTAVDRAGYPRTTCK
ncbi:hypothetical protein D3C73_1539660 [compost metagenome]